MLAVYQVTTNGDDAGLTPTGGTGTEQDPFQIATLRSAIEQANAAVGADAITFDTAGLFATPQTITLGGTQLPTISEELTITGPGAANLTIDADGQSSIFLLSDGQLATDFPVELGAMTLTGGYAQDGGAIFSIESLTLRDSVVSGNSAEKGGGIYSRNQGGTMTIIGSTISGNSANYGGGGIYSFTSYAAGGSTTTITSSTISGNLAGSGGGIYFRNQGGTMMITGSTLSGNGANYDGAGIRSRNYLGGTTTITSSTISGNLAGSHGGGIFSSNFQDGTTTIASSTLSGNSASSGGGISVGASPGTTTTLTSSIVAGNTAQTLAPDLEASGAVTVTTSLIGDNTGSGLSEAQTPDANGNLVGDPTGAGIINPLLDPLGFNGSPTQTRALLPGSPAINRGSDPAGLSSDQRGAPFLRNDGGGVDIGAYERQTVAGLSLTVDTIIDENDGDYSPGDLSLREAIGLANGSVGADTITFDAALSGQTIFLGGTELAIGEALTIDATALAANVTIDAQQQSRVMNFIASTGDLSLAGLTLTGGRTTGDGSINRGGGIRIASNGTLALTNSTLSGNSTTGRFVYGGGIFTSSGAVTLINSTLTGNSTAGDNAPGGGIFTGSGAVTLTNSTLSGNSTTGRLAWGGGIGGNFSSTGAVTFTNSTLTGNSTAGDSAWGGGIFTSSGAVTLTNSTLSGNSTAGGSSPGGGIFTGSSAVTLTQSTLTGNSTGGSSADGGGIRTSGVVTLTNSTRACNSTAGDGADGGGIFVVNSSVNPPLTIQNSIVADNTVALGTGPDLLPDPDSTLTVNYSLIGTGITPTAGDNNVVTNDPLLGPLAFNGGPTLTHALLADSPALDAGDPTAVAGEGGVPLFDQRGLARVADGGVNGLRIDIGAYEAQAPPPALPGDYNLNGAVDAADYVLWRKMLGDTGVVPFSGADGNGDGDITPADYSLWTTNFGDSLPPPGAGGGVAATAAIDEAIALDEQATTQELAAENAAAFDEALVPAGNDVTLLFHSAATSSTRVAKFRLLIMERLIRLDAAQIDLLLAVSPADRFTRDESTGTLHKAAERDLAGDHDVALLVACDAWFASLGGSPS